MTQDCLDIFNTGSEIAGFEFELQQAISTILDVDSVTTEEMYQVVWQVRKFINKLEKKK
jgi:type III secretion system FlhB-like substrate exporter